jgi:hypothetical protein
VRLGGIPVTVNRSVTAQQALHGGALDTFPSSVNQPDDVKARRLRRPEVFIHDRHHVARVEGVQVNRVFDGNLNRFVFQTLNFEHRTLNFEL